MGLDHAALIEAAPDVIAILDRDRRYLFLNPAFETATGLPIRDLLGKTNDEVMEPADAVLWSEAIDVVVALRIPRQVEYAIETPRGPRRFAALISGLPDDQFLVISRDVTDLSAGDRARRLQDLTAALSTAADQRQVAAFFVDAGSRALDAGVGFAWLLRDEGTLELAAAAHPERLPRAAELRTIAMTDEMPIRDVIRSGKPMLFDSRAAMAVDYPEAARTLDESFQAWAMIPFLTGGRSIGASTFGFTAERAFSSEDRAMLVAMSGQAALALERCRLLASERRARAEAEASRIRERELHLTAARLSSALTQHQIAEIVCEEARTALGGRASTAALLHDGAIQMIGSKQASETLVEAFRAAQLVWSENQAEIAVPFIFEDKTIGALSVVLSEHRPVAEQDRQLLIAIGQLAAQALERARLHDAHQRSEEQLRAALAAAHAGTWSVDLPTMRSQRDPSYQALLGISAGPESTEFMSVHPEDRAIAQAAFARTLRDGSTYDPVVRMQRGDGSYIWVQTYGRLDRDAHGQPKTLAGVIVDIDEVRRSSLRAEEERRVNDTLHRLASSFVSELDQDLLIQRMIDEITKLVGADSGAFWPGDLSSTMGNLPSGASMLVVPIITRSGELFGHLLFRHHEPDRFTDEHQRLVNTIASQAAIALENARLYTILRDQKGALELAVERARLADRRKDEFLAMLGHELRNPLAPIVVALELMELKGTDAASKERDVIRRQVTHMSRLIDDLLDVSRITRGKIQLVKEPISIGKIVDDAIEMASPLFEKRMQRIQVELVSDDLLVDVDPTRLAQVIHNLLTNAAKYSEPRTTIRITASATEDEVTVSVRDEGMGIAPELLPHLFDMFVQGERALDRADGGLGIGLTIARSLTELHGGKIRVASDGSGKGSAFHVTLPRSHRPRIPTEPMKPLHRPPQAAQPARVLVVDDNVDAAVMLREMLAKLGHELEIAHDGPSALEVAASFKPDVAVLDIGLPVMSGYELARKLREQLGPDRLRLIALTGYGQDADRARAREVGFDHHLIKPIELDALLSLLAK